MKFKRGEVDALLDLLERVEATPRWWVTVEKERGAAEVEVARAAVEKLRAGLEVALPPPRVTTFEEEVR